MDFIQAGTYFLINEILSIRFRIFFTTNQIKTAITNGKMIDLIKKIRIIFKRRVNF